MAEPQVMVEPFLLSAEDLIANLLVQCASLEEALFLTEVALQWGNPAVVHAELGNLNEIVRGQPGVANLIVREILGHLDLVGVDRRGVVPVEPEPVFLGDTFTELAQSMTDAINSYRHALMSLDLFYTSSWIMHDLLIALKEFSEVFAHFRLVMDEAVPRINAIVNQEFPLPNAVVGPNALEADPVAPNAADGLQEHNGEQGGAESGEEGEEAGFLEQPADAGSAQEPEQTGVLKDPAGTGSGDEPHQVAVLERPAGTGSGEELEHVGVLEKPAGTRLGEEPEHVLVLEKPAGTGSGKEKELVGVLKEPAGSTDNMPSPLAQSCSKRQQEAMFDSPPMAQKCKIRDEPTQLAMPLTGVIDGEFEHGYLVTVKVGSHTLRGALFHCSNQPFPDSVKFPQPITFNSDPAFTAGTSNPQAKPRYPSGSTSPSPYLGAPKQRRQKRRPSTMDPNPPKPNKSGYNFFFAEQHALLKPLHPGKDQEISRIIGERWNGLTEAEKNVYQERGRVDKERYESEVAVYKGKQSTEPGRVISDAVPLNQRPASGCHFTVEGVDVKVEERDIVLDDSDDGDDGDKNQDMDPDTGSNLGSDSESNASIDATTQVPVECQSIGDLGPPERTGADGFEMRKREVIAPVVEAEYKAAEDFSNSTEGDVKMSVRHNNLVEAAQKVVEILSNTVEGDLKAGEGTTNPVEGDLKMGESSNNPVENDVKMGQDSNNIVEGDVKASEGCTTPLQDNTMMVEGGVKSDEDTNLVEGGVKSGEDTDNPIDGDVKMAEALDDKKGEEFNDPAVGDVKKGEEFNDPAVGDVTMGK